MAAVTVYICDQCKKQSQTSTGWVTVARAPQSSSVGFMSVPLTTPDPWFCGYDCLAQWSAALAAELAKYERRKAAR